MINKQIQQDKASNINDLELMINEHEERYFRIDVWQTIKYTIEKVRNNPYSSHSQYALQEIYKTNIKSRERLKKYN